MFVPPQVGLLPRPAQSIKKYDDQKNEKKYLVVPCRFPPSYCSSRKGRGPPVTVLSPPDIRSL